MATSITIFRTLFLIVAWTSLSCFCQVIQSPQQDAAPIKPVTRSKPTTRDRNRDHVSEIASISTFHHHDTKEHKSQNILYDIRQININERARSGAEKPSSQLSYRQNCTIKNKFLDSNMGADRLIHDEVLEQLPMTLTRKVRKIPKVRSGSKRRALNPSTLASFSKLKSKQKMSVSLLTAPSVPSSPTSSLSSNSRADASKLQKPLYHTDVLPPKSFAKSSSISKQTHYRHPVGPSLSSSSSLPEYRFNSTEHSKKSTIHKITKRYASLPGTNFVNPYLDSSDDLYNEVSDKNDSKRITLHIGGLFELTGNSYGGNGHSELLATQMAIAHVNHLEIIPGYRLELLYNDSQCDPGVGTDAFYDLVYRKSRHSSLMMLMGGACNEVTKTLAEIVNYWNIVMISYAADSPVLSEREKYRTFFRMALGHSALDPPRRMLLEHFKWQKVAVLYEEVEALSLAFNTFQKDLASNGITVTTAESLKNAKVEIPAKLSKMKEQDVRIIFAGFSEDVARMVLCEAYKIGLTGSRYVWILVGGLRTRWWQREQNQDTSCTVDELSKAVDGMFTVFGLNGMLRGDTSIGNLTSSDFLREYNSLNGSHPVTMFTVISYDTVWTMALAIRDTLQRWENNGTALPLHQLNYTQMDSVKDVFIETVESLSFSGVSGPVSFDGSNREGVSVIYQIQDGNYTPVALHKPLSSNLIFDCDLCKPIIWAAGKIPKDAQRIVPRMKVILPSVFYPALALCMGGILMAVFFLCYNLYYRRLKFIKLSSPNLNNVAVLGCIMAYCDVILLGLDDTNLTNRAYSIVCTARAFLLSSGFSLAFGAMFAKTFRVHRIFTRVNRGLVKSRLIRDSHLLVIIGVLLVLDMGLVCTWVVVDPMTRVVYNLTQQVSEDDPDLLYQEQLTTCYSNHLQEWLGAFYAYKGLLLVFGLYMAWETRHVKIPALNDSQYIGLNVYNVVIMAVCVVVISNIVSTRPNLAYGMVASFMILSTTVTLCLLFVPKMCAIVASKGNPIVASSGILVDRSNTRRFVFDDRKEVLYRAEVQNRVYKREIMELDQKVCRLERLLDIPLHPIPRLTEELLYLLPQTLGERAPLGFRRGRRRALEWCNSISDGGEGVTWSATDSDEVNTDTSLLSPCHLSSGKSMTKPNANIQCKNLAKLSKSAWARKENRIKAEHGKYQRSIRCGKCHQRKGGLEVHVCSSCCSAKHGKDSSSKSYYKAVCERNHKRKEKESNRQNVSQKDDKDLNYSMVYQSLKLLKLSVPAVPFPEHIDQAKSLPEIYESTRKESLDENLNDNEIRNASSDQVVTNSTSVSSSFKSPKKTCEDFQIEIPFTHHVVDIGDIHAEQSKDTRTNSIQIELCDNNDDDDDVKCSSQLSPSQSWPSLDFRDDEMLWERSKVQGNKLTQYKNKILKKATVYSVSDLQVISFDDQDDNDVDNSGDENGNEVLDSDNDDDNNDDDDDDDDDYFIRGSDNCNHTLCQNQYSPKTLNKIKFYDGNKLNAHLNKSFDSHDFDAHQNQQHPYRYRKLSQNNGILNSHHVHFSKDHKHRKHLYQPLEQSSLIDNTVKSESCPGVNDPNQNFEEDETKSSKQFHFSADNLTHRHRHNWLKHLFKPRFWHHQPHHTKTYSSAHNQNDDNNYQNNNPSYPSLHLSNRLLDHYASNPKVPDTTDDDSSSDKRRLLPLEDQEEFSSSPVSTLTSWQSCSAIDPSWHHDDNNRKASLPANISPLKPSPRILLSSPHSFSNFDVNSNTNARELTNTNYNNANISPVISRDIVDNANLSSTSFLSLPHNESSSFLSIVSSDSSFSSCHEEQCLPLKMTVESRDQNHPKNMCKSPNHRSNHLSTEKSTGTGNQQTSTSSSPSSPKQTHPLPTSSSSSLQPQTFSDRNNQRVSSVENNNPFSFHHQENNTTNDASIPWPMAERNRDSFISEINSGVSECERLDEVSEF